MGGGAAGVMRASGKGTTGVGVSHRAVVLQAFGMWEHRIMLSKPHADLMYASM